jgi:spore germination protein GerM
MRRFTVLKNLLIAGFGAILLLCLVYFMINYFNLKKVNHELLNKLEQDRVALFFMKASPTSFYLKPLLVKVPGKEDKHIEALEALFAGPPEGLGLINIFPVGTGVRNFTLKDGAAVIDLNQRAARLNVGSQGEALAVASIVDTLTKFPDVYQVKILIEGKEVESLAGHVDLTGAFYYDEQSVEPVPIVK